MKKLTVLSMIAILCFSLSACSDSGSSTSEETTKGTEAAVEEETTEEESELRTESETEEETEEETEAESENSVSEEEPESKDNADDEVGNASEDSASVPSNVAAFDEITVVDNENLTITVESFDADDSWGPTFRLFLENKTEDVDLMFAIRDCSVNGIMNDPFWAEEVSAGMKSYSDVTFYNLDDGGINYIEEVELTFRAYDSNDWSADDYFSEEITLNIENSTTEDATYRRTSENGFSDIILADNDDIRVTVIDYDFDYLFGPAFTLYIENFTDRTIMVSAEDVAVNNFMCDPYWAVEVYSGKKAYSDMYWSSSTLEENRIESIDDVQFTLHIYDSNDWMADDIFNETVSFSVE